MCSGSLQAPIPHLSFSITLVSSLEKIQDIGNFLFDIRGVVYGEWSKKRRTFVPQITVISRRGARNSSGTCTCLRFIFPPLVLTVLPSNLRQALCSCSGAHVLVIIRLYIHCPHPRRGMDDSRYLSIQRMHCASMSV